MTRVVQQLLSTNQLPTQTISSSLTWNPRNVFQAVRATYVHTYYVSSQWTHVSVQIHMHGKPSTDVFTSV